MICGMAVTEIQYPKYNKKINTNIIIAIHQPINQPTPPTNQPTTKNIHIIVSSPFVFDLKNVSILLVLDYDLVSFSCATCPPFLVFGLVFYYQPPPKEKFTPAAFFVFVP